jgi:hypothetical protein
MAHAKHIREDMQRSTNHLEAKASSFGTPAWKADRKISREQEQADYAAWLREYRRWTQSGSCSPARIGEIEWGGENCKESVTK